MGKRCGNTECGNHMDVEESHCYEFGEHAEDSCQDFMAYGDPGMELKHIINQLRAELVKSQESVKRLESRGKRDFERINLLESQEYRERKRAETAGAKLSAVMKVVEAAVEEVLLYEEDCSMDLIEAVKALKAYKDKEAGR